MQLDLPEVEDPGEGTERAEVHEIPALVAEQEEAPEDEPDAEALAGAEALADSNFEDIVGEEQAAAGTAEDMAPEAAEGPAPAAASGPEQDASEDEQPKSADASAGGA